MPFKPGQSGNPNGKGLKKDQKKRLASDLLGPHVKTAVERIAEALNSPEREDHQWAVGLVMSYVFGKPAQAVELKADQDIPLIATITIGKQSE